jgi:hypothetical protein
MMFGELSPKEIEARNAWYDKSAARYSGWNITFCDNCPCQNEDYETGAWCNLGAGEPKYEPFSDGVEPKWSGMYFWLPDLPLIMPESWMSLRCGTKYLIPIKSPLYSGFPCVKLSTKEITIPTKLLVRPKN